MLFNKVEDMEDMIVFKRGFILECLAYHRHYMDAGLYIIDASCQLEKQSHRHSGTYVDYKCSLK